MANGNANILKAAIAGAAVGAAAVVLSDKKKRTEIKKTINNLKSKTDQKIRELQSETGQKIRQGKRKLAKKLNEAENAVENLENRRISEI